MNKKKMIVSSILSLAMCSSLVVGGTYALFTHESQTNIAVTSGKVEVKATINNLKTYSMDIEQEAGAFENSGTATIVENEITLDRVTPGDKATFDIEVANNSNVNIQYRTVVSAVEGGSMNGLVVTIDGKSYTGEAVYDTWKTLAPAIPIQTIAVSVELPKEAGNVYQNLTTKFSVKVEAVQGNAEVYNISTANSQNSLEDAVTNATTPTEINLTNGTYEWPTSNMANKNVSFVGTKSTVMDYTDMQSQFGYEESLTNTTLTFEGVTVNWATSESFQGVKNPQKVIYKDCTINGLQYLYGDAEFINCTFNNEVGYCVWTYGANNATFTNCTFYTGGRAILVYNESTSNDFVANITVNGCTFYDSGAYDNNKPKAAVETGQTPYGTNTYNLKISNCTLYGFEANKSTSAAWGNKNDIGAENLTVEISNVVENQISFSNATNTVENILTADTTGSVSVAIPAGTHTLPTSAIAQKEEVEIVGTKDTVIDFTGLQIGYEQNMTQTTLTFTGVTVNWQETEGYQGIKNPKKVIYKDCTINGLQYLYGDAEFINCTFNNKGCWSVWTYGAKNVTFTDCTFNTGGHAVLVYNEAIDFVANITMNNCVFNNDGSVSEPWGHEDLVETGIVSASNNKYNLTFNGCKIVGSNKQALWGNKNFMDTDHLNVIVDGVDVY